jgi:hypothetical protein
MKGKQASANTPVCLCRCASDYCMYVCARICTCVCLTAKVFVSACVSRLSGKCEGSTARIPLCEGFNVLAQVSACAREYKSMYICAGQRVSPPPDVRQGEREIHRFCWIVKNVVETSVCAVPHLVDRTLMGSDVGVGGGGDGGRSGGGSEKQR